MQANSLPAARGWYWFVGGLKLWQRSPGVIGLAAMLTFMLSGVVGSVPWIGSLLICLMGPFLDVFLLRVCHAVSLGRKPDPRELIAGFGADARGNARSRVVGLLILGSVTFVCLMLGKWLVALIAGDAMAQIKAASEAATAVMSGTAAPAAGAATNGSAPLASGVAVAPVKLPFNVLAALLFNLIGISVLSIITWIAPALTAFADVPPVKSLVFSIVACWRNKAAFMVFGLSLACMSIPLSVLTIMGGIGQMLMIMLLFGVLMPACFASNYLSLTDIFGPLPALRDPQNAN